jgi:hypothetical protein
VSRRLPASKRCDGQGGLRSVVRVAIATGQLQKAATNAVKLPKELEFLLLAYRTIIYTIRQASGIRLLNNSCKCPGRLGDPDRVT